MSGSSNAGPGSEDSKKSGPGTTVWLTLCNDILDLVHCDGRAGAGPGCGPGDRPAGSRDDYGDGGVSLRFSPRLTSFILF
jgi:hypothetical protein